MLAATPAATEALVWLLRSREVPEGAGVRLAHGLAAGGESSIGDARRGVNGHGRRSRVQPRAVAATVKSRATVLDEYESV